MEINRAGTLKVSKNTSAAFSRFLLGLSGASVRRTGCYKRWRVVGVCTDSMLGSKRIFPDSQPPLLPALRTRGCSLMSSRALPCHLLAVILPKSQLSLEVKRWQALSKCRKYGNLTNGEQSREGKGQSERIRSLWEAWLPHLLREGLQLVLGVDVLPDALHVIPVPHHAVLHGVAQGQQPPVLLRRGGGKASVAPGPSPRHCFLPSCKLPLPLS